MVETVGKDRVFFVEYGLEEPRVGIETGGVQDDILHPRKAESLASNSLWRDCVPQIKRTLAKP
jgi:hypothetical protein